MSKSPKVPNLVNDEFTNFNYTDTNMHVDAFANYQKLISSDDIIGYQKGDHNDDDKNKHVDNLDDDVDKYKTQIFESRDHNDKNSHHDERERSEKYKHTTDKPTYSSAHEKHHDKSYSDSGTDTKKYDPDDESTWSKETLRVKKMDMIRKLGELMIQGVKISQNYNIDSDYKTMKYEYDLHCNIRSKKNTVEWMSNMMIGIVKGMEMLNDNVDPFGIKFENTWSNKVATNITDYYDVLGEIYEKYTTPGKKMAPELRLFLMLTGSAVSIQMHKIDGRIGALTSLLGGGNNDSGQTLDNDPNMIELLRKKAELDEQLRNKKNEMSKQEHEQAVNFMNDVHKINKSKDDYEQILKMAKDKSMADLNNGLLMSESVRSLKSAESKLSKQNDLINQNRNLIKIQQSLSNMRNDQKLSESSQKRKQPSPVYKKDDSSSDSQSNVSSVSSKSSMVINPKFNEILSKKKPKDNTPSQSSSSLSTPSDVKPITLNLNDKLRSPLSTHSMKNNEPFDLSIDSISFGKKSNGSGKRGRPKGALRLKLGE